MNTMPMNTPEIKDQNVEKEKENGDQMIHNQIQIQMIISHDQGRRNVEDLVRILNPVQKTKAQELMFKNLKNVKEDDYQKFVIHP